MNGSMPKGEFCERMANNPLKDAENYSHEDVFRPLGDVLVEEMPLPFTCCYFCGSCCHCCKSHVL